MLPKPACKRFPAFLCKRCIIGSVLYQLDLAVYITFGVSSPSITAAGQPPQRKDTLVKKRIWIQAILAFTFLLILGCSRQPDGSDFVGKWDPVDKQNKLGHIEIKKTGDSYFMTTADGKERLTATYIKEGNKMQVDISFMKIDFFYFKDRDTITAFSDEWKRSK